MSSKQPAGGPSANTPSAAASSAGIAKEQRKLFVTAVALGIMLNPLNTTTISVALARIQDDFGLTFSQLSWLISTYYLASAIGQPVMGRLGDQFGRKRFFIGGLALASLASILAVFSPNFVWLVVFRILLGLGTSCVYTSGMSLVRHHITDQQAKFLGILTMCMSTASAIGPFLGGMLVKYGDWPAIFWINLVFIAISFSLAFRLLPREQAKRDQRIRIDVPGIALFSTVVFAWLWFFLSLETEPAWWMMAAGAFLLYLFIRLESRLGQPFIDVPFLRRNPVVSQIYLQYGIYNIVFYSFLFGIPIYLQTVRGLDAQQSGLMWLASAVSSVLANGLVNRYVSRNGPKRIVLFGSLCLFAGSLVMSFLADSVPIAILVVMLVLLGFGNGWSNYGLQTSLYAFIRKTETGVASGLLMTSRYTGTIMSAGLLGMMFGSSITTAQLRGLGIACAVLGAIAIVLSLRIPQVRLDP